MARKLIATKDQIKLTLRVPKKATIFRNGFAWDVIGMSLTKKGYWTIRRFGIRVVNNVKKVGPIIEHILESELLNLLAAVENSMARVSKSIARRLGHRQHHIA